MGLASTSRVIQYMLVLLSPSEMIYCAPEAKGQVNVNFSVKKEQG